MSQEILENNRWASTNSKVVNPCKVVLLGDSGVGKTAFLNRLCYDDYSPVNPSTVGMDIHSLKVPINFDKSLTLQLWDTAGQERFRAMTKQYFRNAHAFILVYDITNEQSFLNCRMWLEDISTNGGCQTTLLLGNKEDMASKDRAVSLETAQSLAMNWGLMFAEVSARTGSGVHEIVNQLSLHLLRDGALPFVSNRDVKNCQFTVGKESDRKGNNRCFTYKC